MRMGEVMIEQIGLILEKESEDNLRIGFAVDKAIDEAILEERFGADFCHNLMDINYWER